MRVRNTFIIFIVSGFWHGANWTFIMWGFLNALYIMPSIIFNTNRNNLDIVAQGKYLPSFKELASIILTFSLTVFAWIFFRAENISSAFVFISKMLNPSLFSLPTLRPFNLFVLLIGFVIVEWLSRDKKHGLEFNSALIVKPIRIAIYLIISYSVLFNLKFHEASEFIYFQF